MTFRKRRTQRGQTLVEAVFACFVTLSCALVFSATMPIANVSRGKGEKMAAATSLAYKQIETIKAQGYAALDGPSLVGDGLLNSTTVVNFQSEGLQTTSETGFESSAIDSAGVDSAGTILPGGRSFVQINQSDIDLRQVVVVVFWQEKGVWRSVRVGTLIANM
jgi:hypothetical protein